MRKLSGLTCSDGDSFGNGTSTYLGVYPQIYIHIYSIYSSSILGDKGRVVAANAEAGVVERLNNQPEPRGMLSAFVDDAAAAADDVCGCLSACGTVSVLCAV